MTWEAPPPGFSLRRPNLDDAAAVTALVAASQAALHGAVEVSRAAILRKWHAPDFDLTDDSWLIETDLGQVVAFGAIREILAGRAYEGKLVVNPDYYGRGLGLCLLRNMETAVKAELTRVNGTAAATIHTWSSSANTAECELYLVNGFRRTALFARMEKDLTGELEAAAWPVGVSPRPFRPTDDDAAVYRVLEQAFGAGRSDLAVTPERFSREVVADPRTDPRLWRVASENGAIVGAVLCSLVDAKGRVERLAVSPAGQGRGIGGALLRDAFRLLKERGATGVMLTVEPDVAVEALDLYLRAGMVETRRIEVFEKRVTQHD